MFPMSLTSRTLELTLALLLIPLSSHTTIKVVVTKSLSECIMLDRKQNRCVSYFTLCRDSGSDLPLISWTGGYATAALVSNLTGA